LIKWADEALTNLNQMFEALFTPIIYRKKKVKSFQDGFIKRINKKIILMDEGLCVIDSQFSSVILKEGTFMHLAGYFYALGRILLCTWHSNLAGYFYALGRIGYVFGVT
jgi:hypothetical protein